MDRETILNDTLSALRALRISGVTLEEEIYSHISNALNAADIAYSREVRLAPGCRVDYLLPEGIIIEVKKGKPNRTALLSQLERYAGLDEVSHLIVIVQRGVSLPQKICTKPCSSLILDRQWGIAL